MTDHRIAKLRFLFATLYCAILVWLFPGLAPYVWFIPLGLLMPVIGTPAPCATICNEGTQTDEIQLTFTGITNGTCTDCGNMNTTISTPFNGTCLYFTGTTLITLCGGANHQVQTRFAWDGSIAPGSRWVIYDSNLFGGSQVGLWTTSLGTGLDCSAEIPSVSIDSVSGGFGECTWTGAQVTITPTGSLL